MLENPGIAVVALGPVGALGGAELAGAAGIGNGADTGAGDC